MTDEKKNDNSGRVQIIDGKVVWYFQNDTIAEIKLDDVAIVGEYTNSNGPYFDDWFLVFVTSDGQWKHVSWYADNIDELTATLSEKFQTDFARSFLTGSTKWASVVRHPAHLKNEPLFILTPTENYKEAKTFFQKLKSAMGVGEFDTTQYINFTEAVKRELNNE